MSGRTILATIRVVIPAGAAKPAPPVGPALGQHGLNIMSFCKEFNAKTAGFLAQVPVPVMITAFKDKTFEWKMRSPPTSYFVKKAAGVASGSGRPGHGQTAQISLKHVYHIAQLKSRDEGAQHIAMESMCRSVISAAKSMGIEVVR